MLRKLPATTTLLALALLASSVAIPVAGAQTTSSLVTPRPELTLAANAAPPGYEETHPGFMQVGGVPIDDRLLRRSGGGPGPGWIWSASYERATEPTEETIAKQGQDIAAILARRLGNTALLGDWDGIETHEPGDHVVLYHFTYQRFDSDAASQGALLVFSRGNLV